MTETRRKKNDIQLPENNIFGVEPGMTTEAIADGYYLMLPPLSAGEHSIHFAGRVVVPEVIDFRLDISYDLTVEPGRK
jgi:hypothetical protein